MIAERDKEAAEGKNSVLQTQGNDTAASANSWRQRVTAIRLKLLL